MFLTATSFFNADKIKKLHQFLQVNLWFSPDSKIAGKLTCYYRSCVVKGIGMIIDLGDENCDLLSLRKCHDMFYVHFNFLDYEGILAAIRKYLSLLRFQYLSANSCNRISPLKISFKLIMMK